MSNAKERMLPGPERLRAYDLAQQLGLAVDQVVRDCRVRKHLAIQLVRAADSTILNIAECAGNFSLGRKRFHYEIAHGSAAECIAALTRIIRQRHCSHAVDARRKANMLCVMLTRLIDRQKT